MVNWGLESEFPVIEDQYRIGDLLQKAELVSEDTIERVARSNNIGVRIGQMLILGGFISHDELQAALQVQSLLREGSADKSTAIEALKLTRSKGLKLDQALESLKAHECTTSVSNNRLGQLLVESAVITESELADGLIMAQATGLPLGKILVLAGILHEADLTHLVRIQLLLRQGSLERSTAIAQIACLGQGLEFDSKKPVKDHGHKDYKENKSGARPQRDIDCTPVNIPVPPPAIFPRQVTNPEDLLVRTGIVSDAQWVQAIHECAITGKRTEELLVERGVIDEQTMQMAVEISEAVNGGMLELNRASQAMAQSVPPVRVEDAVVETRSSIEAPHVSDMPMALPACYPQSLADFLVLSNAITIEQCQRARKMASGTKLDEIGVLLRINALSRVEVDIASMCYQHMQDSLVTLDEAVFTHQVFKKAIETGALSILDLASALLNKEDFQAIAKQLSALSRNTDPYEEERRASYRQILNAWS